MCNGCFDVFISHYSEGERDESGYVLFKKLDYIEPNYFEIKTFSDSIEREFPNFSKIYNQALEAEHRGLDEIAGMGYRKALEFLIKDFLIEQDEGKKVSIEKMPLGKCIEDLIDNKQLKIVVSRATWLGNDQVIIITIDY